MTGTIREVRLSDAHAIADIYNYYIEHTTVTYETEPVTAGEMERRIRDISEGHPYLVYEDDGVVTGYCYAHPWKVRAAYRHTFETTIYLDHRVMHHGIGRQLMARLTDMCRERGCHVLIACVTDENAESRAFHLRLGFKQAGHYEQVGRKFGRWIGIDDFELILPDSGR